MIFPTRTRPITVSFFIGQTDWHALSTDPSYHKILVLLDRKPENPEYNFPENLTDFSLF